MTTGLEEIAALVKYSSTRDEFLKDLLLQLSGSEARTLYDTLCAKFLYFDIVANLPIEVLSLIFGYLPFTGSFRLQRVSKAWKEKLSSRSLQSACLAPVFASHIPPLAGEPSLASDKLFALRAKHVLAVQHRLPYSWGLHVVTTRIGFQRNDMGMWNCDYYNGVFAWIPAGIPGVHMPEAECVRTFSLFTGALNTHRALDRGRILCVRLMTAHLVLITRAGTAYAFSLENDSVADLNLLNANVECIGGRGRYFTMIWANPHDRRTVWVWDLHTHSTKRVDINFDDADVRSLSISENGGRLAVTRTSVSSPGSRFPTMTLKKFEMETGQETESTILPWKQWWGNTNRYHDMGSGRIVGRGIKQYHPQGLRRVFETFVDTVPQYRSLRENKDRFQTICQSLDVKNPHDPKIDTWGSPRFRLSIVDLHAANPFPYGQLRSYLFCVSSFDRDVKLSGADKSLIIDEIPSHKYS